MPKPNRPLLLSLSLSLVISLLIYNSLLFADESITITTYYPSPYGSYNQLQANQLSVGDTNNDGSLTSADLPDNNGDIRLKPQSATPATGKQGEVAYVTDGYLYAYKDSTSGWVKQGGGAPDYDSGWYADSSSTNHTTTITHNLGAIPSRIQFWFSPDKPPSNWVYPISVYGMSVSVGLGSGFGYRNPEGIMVNTTTLLYSMYTGAYMYCYMDLSLGWVVWSSGYYRVQMWK